MTPRIWNRLEQAALLALIIFYALSESWLIPLRTGSSTFTLILFLVLKAVPLVAALPGVFFGRRYTSQWLSMAVMLYFLEGAWGFNDSGITGMLARVEIGLSVLLFVTAVGHARAALPRGQSR
ncbi:MAG: DUF2069 domain-containing protein [Azoarcus sp.]|nr:DUF2069 domain-containing protein [Azoarcus sp.]